MRYTQGKIGRVFVVKFEDGDILLEKLAELVKKEKIKSAAMVFIGALKKGDLVTGPKKPLIPPEPNKVNFEKAWEALGIGTIFTPAPISSSGNANNKLVRGFTNKSGPQIHIHSAMGKKLKTLTGCVRGKSEVFLVIEAIIFELKGVSAAKSIDPETGLNLLRIYGK